MSAGNALIHVSRDKRECFSVNGVQLMKWPARSPDLNPIEKLWVILVRRVYGAGHQFSSKTDLVTCVLEFWNRLKIT